MNENEVLAYLQGYIEKFSSSTGATPIQKDSSWCRNIPSKAGVYSIYENGKIVYCGETADLRERMRDLGDTRHHTLRRSVGHRIFNGRANFQKATSRRKFPFEFEAELDKHMTQLSVKAIPINLGRKEIEDSLIKSEKPIYNKKPRRGTEAAI